MGYLDYLPKFTYTLKNLSGTVSDIFRRVAFTQKTRENPANYNTKVVEGVFRPEQVAKNELLSSEYYWQIMLMNNIVSKDEYPDSQRAYSNKIREMEGGTSLSFAQFFGSTPRNGDVMYSITAGNTVDFESGGVVSNYNSELRKIDMNYVFGDGFSGDGASAALYGLDDGGDFIEKGKLQFKRKLSIAGSVSYFYDANERETTPYYIPPAGTNTGGTFTSPLDTTPATGTLLDLFLNDTALPTGYFIRTEIQNYREDDLRKRNLKIPPQITTDLVDRETRRLLKEGQTEEISTVSSFEIRSVGSSSTTTVDQLSGGTNTSTTSTSGSGGGSY